MELLGDLAAGNGAVLVDDFLDKLVVALLDQRQIRAFLVHKQMSFPKLDR